MIFKIIAIVSGIVAGIFVLLLPLWILGVPGVDNQYAKGWKMGLNVLLLYPPGWLGNYAIFCISKKLSANSQRRWRQISSGVALTLLLAAILRMVQAIMVMSG